MHCHRELVERLLLLLLLLLLWTHHMAPIVV